MADVRSVQAEFDALRSLRLLPASAQHVHNYIVTRREKRGDVIYVFSECIAPGDCNQRNKMEIEYT